MKKLENSKKKITEIFLWISVALIITLTYVANYYFHFSSAISAIIWILSIILSISIIYLTPTGRHWLHFVKEAKTELQKVVWPTRQETIQVSSIVIIMVVFTSLVLWGIDSIMIWSIAKLTSLG